MKCCLSSGTHVLYIAIALAGLAVLTSPPAAAQGNLRFLRHAPTSYLTEEDRRLLREAATLVLSETGRNERTWQNPASGNSGRIEQRGRFTSEDGRDCRRILMQNRTKRHGNDEWTAQVCREEGGRWLLDPEARSAKKGGSETQPR